MANTAFPNHQEAKILNSTLRGATTGTNFFSVTGGATLYLALLTNSTNDGSFAEVASGAGYTARPAFTATSSQCFQKTSSTGEADAATPSLSNINPITFTASGTISGIVGVAICTASALSGTITSDTSVLYYGDLTGGSVTLTAGQSITFAANAITVTLD
jgi:hypothetical protein